MGIFLVQSIEFAAKSWEAREVSARSIWQPPLYYIKSIIPIAVFLLMLQSLAELVRAVLLFLGISFTDPRESLSTPSSTGDEHV